MTTLCRPMSRRIASITTLLALVLAAPAGAATPAATPTPTAAATVAATPAGTPPPDVSDAFQGSLPPAPTATPVATATVTDSTDQNNTNRNTLFIIGGLLVVGFGAMGWFIMRDARSALPEDERLELSRSRDQGPHAHKLKAKSKARSKGRAQRNARKSNRSSLAR